MRIGDIDFVAWVELSDAFDNLATLVYHSYEYNRQMNGTLAIQYGNSEEFDMTVEDYEILEKEYPDWSMSERIDYFFQNICDKQGIMLVNYYQLEKLEQLKLLKNKIE